MSESSAIFGIPNYSVSNQIHRMSVTQNSVASPPLSPEAQIRAHLEHNGQKIKWLAGKIEVTKGHLGNILHGRKKLTDEIREKINTTLKTNY